MFVVGIQLQGREICHQKLGGGVFLPADLLTVSKSAGKQLVNAPARQKYTKDILPVRVTVLLSPFLEKRDMIVVVLI